MKNVVLSSMIVAVGLAMCGSASAALPALKVEGDKLCAGGQPIVLRGLNWGWWHLSNTVYTEDDMRRQAEWGANVLRLAFSYGDVEDPENPGMLREDGVKDVDEVLAWAEKYGQYVILDMHVCPGGQDPAHYCDKGRNLLWKDAACRARFLSLWRELAKRYRRNNALGAYELLNEPVTQKPEPSLLVDIQKAAVAEIRKVDPDKVIVATGDQWSNAKDMVDAIKLDDPNILYTFHFYEGGDRVRWLRNEGERRGEAGTSGWTRFEVPVKIGHMDREFALILRSNKNSGAAWFDDIEVRDQNGGLVREFHFDRNTDGMWVERAPKTDGSRDESVGHDRPGSLKVAGTESYNGWIGPRIKTYGLSQTYRITGWVKLENATGGTYAAAAVFGINSPELDEADVRSRFAPAIAFRDKYKVPLFVGEFSAGRENGPAGYQENSVRLRIRLFEEHGLSWTYWNFRETTNPNGMALHAMKRDGTGDYPINEPLLKILKDGWKANRK